MNMIAYESQHFSPELAKFFKTFSVQNLKFMNYLKKIHLYSYS